MLIQDTAKTEVFIAPTTQYHVRETHVEKKPTESKINEQGTPFKKEYDSWTIFNEVIY